MKKILLILFIIFSTFSFSMPRVGTEIGNILPTIEVEGFNPESIDGKLTIVKFWQSTCPPCIKEMDSLKSFYSKNKNKINLVYVSVNRDERVFNEYTNKTNLKQYLPVFYDKDRVTWTKFGLQKTPSTFILDDKGVILDKWVGFMEWNDITLDDLKSFAN